MSEIEEVDLPTLNGRQSAFVREYLCDLDGAQAAIRAGYSPETASSIASGYLLRHAGIAAAIERGKAQRLSRVNMTQDTVLHEMGRLHFRISLIM